jgi:chromosome segregation ATPase
MADEVRRRVLQLEAKIVGLDAIKAASQTLNKLAKDATDSGISFAKFGKDSQTVGRSFEAWQGQLQNAGNEIKQLPQRIEYLKNTMAKLAAEGQRGSAAFLAMQRELNRLADTQNKLNAAAAGNTNAFKGLQQGVRNTAYQLTDFTVSVQNGTKASVAFSQQVPQILGQFGALGAALGLVSVAIGVLAGKQIDNIATSLGWMKDKSADLAKETKELNTALDQLKAGLDDVERLGREIDMKGAMEAFNRLSKTARETARNILLVRQQMADLNWANQVEGAKKAAAEITNFKEGLFGFLGGISGDKRVKAIGDQFGLVGKDAAAASAALLGLRDGTVSYQHAVESLVPLVGKGNEEFRKRVRAITELAVQEGEYYNQASATSKLLEDMNKAIETGTDIKIPEKAKKKREKEIKEFRDDLNAIQKLMQDFGKQAEIRFELPVQLDALKDPQIIATLTSLGFKQEDLTKKTRELEMQLKKARGEWTLLDEVAARGLADQEKFDQYVKTVEQMAVELESGKMSAEVFWTQLKKIQEFNPVVAVEGLKKLKEPLDEMGVAIGTTIASGLSGLVDVLVESQKSFREWAVDVLKQLAKVIIKLAVVGAMKKALGGTSFGSFLGITASAKGNSFSGGTTLPKNVILNTPTLFKFASGGVFGTRMGVGGEAGPEAVVPLRRTTQGNLGVEASPVNITVNNTVSRDTAVEVESTNEPDGTRNISILVRREVRNAMGDGSMDAVMRNNYGMRRAAMG